MRERSKEDTAVPKRWTPIIAMRGGGGQYDLYWYNASDNNGQMKELERALGVYASWNCARLSSRDYVIVYTRSHDMSADMYTSLMTQDYSSDYSYSLIRIRQSNGLILMFWSKNDQAWSGSGLGIESGF